MASNDLVKRVQQIGRRLTPLQKIALGAVTITAIAGAFVLSRTGTEPSMAPLFTDLTSADASAVVDQLSTQGVAYELTDAGHTVLVPAGEVYNLRVSMAGAGLPSSNEGYALLDKQGITTSEFRQQVDYQRAIEGELAKTLEAMNGIGSATVHLALPAESVFVEEQASPTAAVLVTAKSTGGITGDEVQAIVHLVSSSVKNMKPADVTVVDADGVVLSAAGAGATGGAAGSGRSDVVGDFERKMQSTIMALLARTTGAGKVAVTVNADLDLDSSQSTSEDYGSLQEGDTGSEVVSDNVSTEIYGAGSTAGNTGILGPDGVIVTPEIPTTPVAEGDYAQGDQQRTYALDRVVETVTKAPGEIQRLNVAVLVDDTAVSKELAAEIEKVVAAAAGIDPDRGDSVIVSRVPFDVSASEEATAASAASDATAKSAQTMELIRTGVVAFVIIIALILAYRSARKARRVTSIPINVGEIASKRDTTPELDAPVSVTSALADRVDPMAELGEIATRRPDEVARVLRAWLAESKASQ